MRVILGVANTAKIGCLRKEAENLLREAEKFLELDLLREVINNHGGFAKSL